MYAKFMMPLVDERLMARFGISLETLRVWHRRLGQGLGVGNPAHWAAGDR
jgi:hypothetical protein